MNTSTHQDAAKLVQRYYRTEYGTRYSLSFHQNQLYEKWAARQRKGKANADYSFTTFYKSLDVADRKAITIETVTHGHTKLIP
jgi:hypothetical protein